MYRKLLIGAALLLSACGPKVTHEACVKSDAQTYISIDRSESGTTGPNRAGQEAFNKRILVDGFNNRRESQFGFVMKSEVPGSASSDMTCKSTKITCEDPNATYRYSAQRVLQDHAKNLYGMGRPDLEMQGRLGA